MKTFLRAGIIALMSLIVTNILLFAAAWMIDPDAYGDELGYWMLVITHGDGLIGMPINSPTGIIFFLVIFGAVVYWSNRTVPMGETHSV